MIRGVVSVAVLSFAIAGCSSLSQGDPRERQSLSSAAIDAPVASPEAGRSVTEKPVVRESPLAPSFHPGPIGDRPTYPLLSPLDLDAWPFGWVQDGTDSVRLGLQPRFWSDQKPLWRSALESSSLSLAARRWESVARGAKTSEESFRASWHLWLTYRQAGLYPEARSWLDNAYAKRPTAVVALERTWDQVFRLRDLDGARQSWTSVAGPWPTDDDFRKAKLLRQHLFLGTKSLKGEGADDYVSNILIDRDDLWAGTWNGAVVRISLTTGQSDLILSRGDAVSPVKLLVATGWFVYAFQNQSLQRYSKVTGTWRSFPYPAGWTGLRVQAAAADGEESLWVAYLGLGLWHWNAGQWVLIDDSGGGPFLNALAPDGQGGYWFGTKDRGLWSWKNGQWSAVEALGAEMPRDISVIQPDSSATRWLVGTWGEGAWVLTQGVLRPLSQNGEYVTSAAWTDRGPVWGTLDEGLVEIAAGQRSVLGPSDGLPPGGVSSLVSWNGRWIWGTNGQGLAWWSEHENPSLLR